MTRHRIAAIGACAALLALSAAADAQAAPAGWIATSIDTMKESMDRSSDPMTQAQIDQHVAQLAALGPTHITVDTPMDRPARYAMWVNAIRAQGKKVWHRPADWGYPSAPAHADPNVTPAIYLDRVQQFILQNPGLFKPGDIFDGDSEADGDAYWRRYPVEQWWNDSQPSIACAEFNRYLVDLHTVADEAFRRVGITGVETRIRSLNPWWATARCLTDGTIAALGGYLTLDAYFADDSTDPAVVARVVRDRLNQWHAFRPNASIVLGEYGYSNDLPVGDETQRAVVTAVLDEIRLHPAVKGLNYWAGAGGPGQGG